MSDDLAERTEEMVLPPSVTRLVALGDPHGDLLGLELVLEAEEGPGTAIVSVGDNVGYADGTTSSYMCTLLEERGIRSVTGNHEAWSPEGRLFLSPPGLPRELTDEAAAWCRSLPYRLRVRADAAPELTLHVVHTLPQWAYVGPKSAERLLDLEGARVVVCGHSHRPAIYDVGPRGGVKVHQVDPRSARPRRVPLERGRRYVVDAGSLAFPSAPRRGRCPERGTYAAVDLDGLSLAVHPLDKRARLAELMRRMSERGPDEEATGEEDAGD